MARKKKRKLPIFLAVIVLIIVVLGVMVKWNSGYTENVSGSVNAYNKFKDALISGGTVSLSSDDINSLVANAFEAQTHRGVTIKGIYVNIPQNKLDIKIPVAYKGQNFLVSSSGKAALKDGCIAYLPDSFKIGAIPLPKNFILNKLKAMYSSKFTIETDGIYINKSALPVTVNSVKIENSNLKIGVEKLKLNLSSSKASKIRDELLNLVKNLNAADKAKVNDAIKYIENNPNALSDVKAKLSGVSNSQVKEIIKQLVPENSGSASNTSSNTGSNSSGNNSSSSQDGKKIDADTIAGLSKDLAVAAGKVSDSAEKAVIGSIQAQVSSGTLNPSAIKPQYSALNKTQRNQVYNAVTSSINPFYFTKISSMFKK